MHEDTHESPFKLLIYTLLFHNLGIKVCSYHLFVTVL